MLRLRMRSIPRFLCKWYAFGVVCVRGQYLNCVLRLTLIRGCFVCVEATCLDYVSISSYVGYLMLRFFLIYAYVVTCICIWSYMCDKYTYVHVSYNVIFISNVLFGGRILVAVLTFLWEWRSHHPFFTNYFCWLPRWSLRFRYVTKHSWPQWCWECRAWPTSCQVAPMTHISNIPPSLHGYDATMRSFLWKAFVTT